MDTLYFQPEIKEFTRVKKGVKFRGFASTPDVDRQEDIVVPAAFEKSLDTFLKNPVLLRSHNPDRPVGNILTKGEDAPVISEKGLAVSGLITEKETGEQAAAGEMKGLSIGFIPKVWEYELRGTGKFDRDGQELQLEVRILRELELIEISIVTTPANADSLFTVQKSLHKHFSKLPSPIMKELCNYCDEDAKKAVGKIGKKFICKGCADEVCTKGDDVEEVKFESEEEAKAFAQLKDVEHFEIMEKNGEFSVKVLDEGDGGEEGEEGKEGDGKEGEGEGEKGTKKKEKKDDAGDGDGDGDGEGEGEGDGEGKEGDGEGEGEEGAGDGKPKEGSEPAEGDGEKPSEGDGSEEGASEGGEDKIVLTDEHKERLTEIVKLLGSVDDATVAESKYKKPKKPKGKMTVDVTIDTKVLQILLPILQKMAMDMKEQREINTKLVGALEALPVYKGKSIRTMQFEAAEVETEDEAKTNQKKQDKSFLSFLGSAKKSGQTVTVEA